MIHPHRLWALSALLVTLVLGACSTPDDLNAPTLEPQFGTADEDRGVDVAFVSTGRIYSLSEQSGPTYEDGAHIGDYSKVLLKRHDSSGNVTWSKEIKSDQCRGYDDTVAEEYGFDYYYSCFSTKAISVVADAQGNVNVLTSYSEAYDDSWYSYTGITYAITKYNALGNYLSEVNFYDDGSTLNPVSFTVDGSGNVYVARRDGDTYTSSVAKYSTSGSLLWQRTSAVGTPSDITVSSGGSVYVVGSAGFARYTNSGNLSWKKPGNFEQVTISGSNLYTRYRKDIRKYDGNGNQLWLRTQSGLKTLVIQDMRGDGSGNIYLSGKYEVLAPDWNAMTRKLNSSGSVLWTKTYGTPAYDDAKGIATIDGSEIYTTGLTKGSLAHTNKGGEDGYLRKMNATGGTVWTR